VQAVNDHTPEPYYTIIVHETKEVIASFHSERLAKQFTEKLNTRFGAGNYSVIPSEKNLTPVVEKSK